MLILGIESSCDETGVALYGENGLLAHKVYSQIALHAQFGGVVPELASRDHIRKLLPLIDETLKTTNHSLKDLSGIAYTAGPGLMGALMVGGIVAQTLAFILDCPLIPINHLEAHLYSPFINQQPTFPFLGLLVSGGHTLLVEATAFGHYQLLGETLDDAVGEAFDKVAKILGFPYPGGVKLAKLADTTPKTRFNFPIPMLRHPGYDFSFSGLKTAAFTCFNQLTELQRNALIGEIAYAFQKAALASLLIKSKKALKHLHSPNFVLAGGVSANFSLRQQFKNLQERLKFNFFAPELTFCGDNGAMIAYLGYLYAQNTSLLPVETLPLFPRLSLTETNNPLQKYFKQK